MEAVSMDRAASTASDLKAAFNNKVEMNQVKGKKSAFDWNKGDILGFFDDVEHKPGPKTGGYNVEASAQASFKKVVDAIKKLVNNNDKKKRIFLDSELHATYQHKEFRLETIFDLVGWIFSVTGTSPAAATTKNYYYPLACLYSVFWRRLTEVNLPFDHDPGMIQMTWFEQKQGKDKVTRICISATLDGQGLAQQKNAARLRREQVLIDSGLLDKNMRGKTLVTSPNPQYFGHCAETIPFLFIKAVLGSVDAATAQGFAFKPKLILPDKVGDKFEYFKPTGVFADPCANCAHLVQALRFKDPNFKAPS
ncbi:uncharacterized protein EDB91DRAFT_1254087 [Suillus paluster]|uniref:uncharacterized protein n=1 Tax=Suillus paluster TaxID=48578 RepID=UPI001B85E842|nr:uncharacterized protein EDB91DRAFT_1254087 [Suillus paluster]KAG1726973.1 hypothetical protein EDB91DRAFT_1254087 [Suillus paluster]